MTELEKRKWLAKIEYEISSNLPDNATDDDLFFLYASLANYCTGNLVRWSKGEE